VAETGTATVQETGRILGPKGEKVGAVICWGCGQNDIAVRSVGVPQEQTVTTAPKMVQFEPFILVFKTDGLLKDFSSSCFFMSNSLLDLRTMILY
jgi:hypothetical protein